jgi:hypothetical protein
MVLTKHIAAPPKRVFDAVADVATLPMRIPEIKAVEMLTTGHVGVGTKFKETRMMFGKETSETFEITEFSPPAKLTMKAVSCGVEYTAEHRFKPDRGGTLLELEMRHRALTLYAKLFRPLGWLMGGMMRKALAKDLDALAAAVEKKI